MALLTTNEDHINQIVKHLDVVSFIMLLCTCKHLFKLRKGCMKFLHINEKFAEYCDKLPYVAAFSSSYIQLQRFSIPEKYPSVISCSNKTIDEQKLNNTLMVLGYHCTSNPEMFGPFRHNFGLVDLCCKLICQKFNYKYTRAYSKLYSIFWLKWHIINVNVIDICEIAYHVKNRKYRNLMSKLASINFDIHKKNVNQTLSYMMKYLEFQFEKHFRIAIIYIIFAYIEENVEYIKSLPKLCITIQQKANELSNNLLDVKSFPKYLQKFIQKKLIVVADILQ